MTTNANNTKNNMPAKIRNFKYVFFFSLFVCVFVASACKEQNLDAAPNNANTVTPKKVEAKTDDPIILAFGDSLTEGYGLDKSQSYPSLLQNKLAENGYKYRVVNAGISGDTTAGGANRITAAILDPKTEIMILELGANDMLRGQDLRQTKQNLATIIEKAQAQKITVVLAGMEAPTNLGEDYQRDFHNLFTDLSKQYNLKLIPFFLADVAGKAELNQNDGIHPNTKGTPIVVENIWRVLEPLLKK